MGCQHSTPITKMHPGGQLSGIRVVGISGRSGALLDQITIHYVIPKGEQGSSSSSSTATIDANSNSSSNPDEVSDQQEHKRSFGSDSGGMDFDRVDVSKPGTTISLRSNAVVDAITINQIRHGGEGGYSWNESLCLRQGEYIHKVQVRTAGGGSGGTVGYLEFETNLGSSITGGRCATTSTATTTKNKFSNGTTTTTFGNIYYNTTYYETCGGTTSDCGGGGGGGGGGCGGGGCGGGGE